MGKEITVIISSQVINMKGLDSFNMNSECVQSQDKFEQDERKNIGTNKDFFGDVYCRHLLNDKESILEKDEKNLLIEKINNGEFINVFNENKKSVSTTFKKIFNSDQKKADNIWGYNTTMLSIDNLFNGKTNFTNKNTTIVLAPKVSQDIGLIEIMLNTIAEKTKIDPKLIFLEATEEEILQAAKDPEVTKFTNFRDKSEKEISEIIKDRNNSCKTAMSKIEKTGKYSTNRIVGYENQKQFSDSLKLAKISQDFNINVGAFIEL